MQLQGHMFLDVDVQRNIQVNLKKNQKKVIGEDQFYIFSI